MRTLLFSLLISAQAASAAFSCGYMLKANPARRGVMQILRIAKIPGLTVRQARERLEDLDYLNEMRVKPADFQKIARGLIRRNPLTAGQVVDLLTEIFPAIARGDKRLRLDNPSRYDYEIAHPMVRDQKSYYSCWAMASTCVAEMNQGEGVVLSHRYLYHNYIRGRLFELLDNPDIEEITWNSAFGYFETTDEGGDPRGTFREIGEFWKAVGLANEFGMVPDQLWTAQKAFELPENRIRFLESIKRLINAHRKALQYITNASSKKVLRAEYVNRIQELLKATFGEIPSGEKLEAMRVNAFPAGAKVVRNIVDSAWSHRDEEYFTGIESMKTYDQNGKPIMMKVQVETRLSPIDAVIGHITSNIRKAVENPTRKGNNAFFISYNMPKANRMVHYRDGGAVLDAHPDLRDAPRWELRHAIVATGYETDFYGNVIGIKLLNSYGLEEGINGITHMTDRFYRNFMFDVVYAEAPEAK